MLAKLSSTKLSLTSSKTQLKEGSETPSSTSVRGRSQELLSQRTQDDPLSFSPHFRHWECQSLRRAKQERQERSPDPKMDSYQHPLVLPALIRHCKRRLHQLPWTRFRSQGRNEDQDISLHRHCTTYQWQDAYSQSEKNKPISWNEMQSVPLVPHQLQSESGLRRSFW